jgi:hypothetical protein
MTTVDEAFLALTRLWAERDRLRREMDAIAALVEAHGCDCEWDSPKLCLACRIGVHATEAKR